MKSTLEQGKSKLEKICNELRENTLEPAKKEADQIIQEANQNASEIIKEAEKEGMRLIESARGQIEQERNVFQSSLSQAMKQGFEALKQDIEQKLFNEQLEHLVQHKAKDPEIIAKLINCIVQAIEKEGISADLTAIIPRHIPEREVNLMLAEDVLKKLEQHSVQVGDFAAGAQIKLKNKNLTIDMSDGAIQELLSNYIRKDFRKLIFLNKP